MPSSTSSPLRADALKAKASALGFDAVGITSPEAVAGAGDKLHEFLEAGFHGDMAWLKERAHQREGPKALWPEVRSIIAVGHNYGPEADPLEALTHKKRGVVSVYAQGKDYHDVLKKRLKQLARWMVEQGPAEVKVFVDTAPVMEKPLAAAAGIGWQGKHTNLVSTEHGSWLFLGAIFTTLELTPDEPHTDRCGSCQACLDICPTDAFPAPYQLDARRCISYLTIEHQGPIPVAFRKAMGNRIYGCDDCLAVCPWNKFASSAREAAYHARVELKRPELKDLLTLDDASFRQVFAGSPIKRTGRNRFLRNVLIAAGNSGDASLLPLIKPLLSDDSSLVRGAAIWALHELAAPDVYAELKRDGAAREPDPDVRSEWARD